MAMIPVSALPGRGRNDHGGRWGQLGSRDPFVQPIRGVDRFQVHPRAQFRAEAYTPFNSTGDRGHIPASAFGTAPGRFHVVPQHPAAYFSGQQRDSLPQQAAFRRQVLDIIKIDYDQRTPTNFAQFQASAATIPSRVPPVPLRCYLPEPDAPYPIPYQPVKIGRLPPENGSRAGHQNPHFTLPNRQLEAGVPLSGGGYKRHRRKRRAPKLHSGGLQRRKRRYLMGSARAYRPLRPCPPCKALTGLGYRGGAYRQPYDGIDRIERPGERAWQVNSIPIPERGNEAAPVNPPAFAEPPRVSLAPPRTRIPFTNPRAAYFPRAIQQDTQYDVWNQPISFQMPAIVGPDYSSTRFAYLRDEQAQPFGPYGAGVGSWSDKDERMYQHIRRSELSRGMNLNAAERIAAATVNKQRKYDGRYSR